MTLDGQLWLSAGRERPRDDHEIHEPGFVDSPAEQEMISRFCGANCGGVNGKAFAVRRGYRTFSTSRVRSSADAGRPKTVGGFENAVRDFVRGR